MEFIARIPTIANRDGETVNPNDLFGNDWRALCYNLNMVIYYWENPYEGCDGNPKAISEWEIKSKKPQVLIEKIASRHGLKIKWCGENDITLGDQWELYKRHWYIGQIVCV